MIKVKLLVMLVALALIAVLPAGAWMGPEYIAGALPLAAITPTGTIGSGIYETTTWSSGVGSSAATDSFASDVISPFGGGAFFDPCGPFAAGPIGGFAQTGLGSNLGTQQSATSGGTHTTAFGLGPLPGLVFGTPIPGPGGLVYC
jgi:hypothetical protein